MGKINDITTKDIAELILELQEKPNKKGSRDYLIKKIQKNIHDNKLIKGHTGIRNQKLYTTQEATIIINQLIKNKKNIETNEKLKPVTETEIYKKLSAKLIKDYEYDPQAIAADININKRTEKLLKEKKTEFYLAAIASKRAYELDTKKLKTDIEKYFKFLEYETDNYEEKPQRIINLENNLNDYENYRYN